jgi:hypothetical protein
MFFADNNFSRIFSPIPNPASQRLGGLMDLDIIKAQIMQGPNEVLGGNDLRFYIQIL